MGNKMLIDATHPEETRVVVTRGNRVEEFDYESAARKQRRGNIYLAKVARIEPSLQAAFVNYGGNRHGFLAFAEIHPDYYQIPVAVREAMMREDALDREQPSYHGENSSAPHDYGNGGDNESPPESNEKEHSSRHRDYDSPAEMHKEAEPETRIEHASEEGDPQGHAEAHSGNEFPQPDAQVSTGFRESAMPLEAALPPVIYEEFMAAVARGEEARDEIPAHADDVETNGQSQDRRDADNRSEASTHGASKSEELSEHKLSSGTNESEGSAAESEHGWHRHRPSGDEGGGVISVPESPTPTPVEVVGSEDALEEVPQRHKRRWRQYKIQEVIKRNQIVLIQVVKEERGTKGAALTTYLSLAGRYTVLMPNTASGGGISRKITVPADRKRLKEIALELEVPEGMGLIIRTAGASRTKAEIKRDFEYLLRLWENVRDLTLRSTAPCLVYEEGDLIKRSIRDLYNKDIDEILVAGDEAYREAKEFMRMLMPSHAKNVQLYKDPEPLLTKYEVERQLNQMFSPVVTLRSGGYIVLNQTEALVAIDVNSGRATREYSIEDTALKTNLEASEEVARQVRLRDLAGLIVIDFIDMDERRNNRAVERRLKECLRHDRARIQVGHISHFGLLEMSRQRLRQGVVEVSTMPCPTCQGVGHIRSTESVGLMILRSIEDHLRTLGAANITAGMSAEAALYILNYKRSYLKDIEGRYGINIIVAADEKAQGAHFAIERSSEPLPIAVEETKAVHMKPAYVNGVEEEEDEPEVAAEGEDKREPRRKRRRRRGRGDNLPEFAAVNGSRAPEVTAGANGVSQELSAADSEFESEEDGDDSDGAGELQDGEARAGENGTAKDTESGFRRNRRRGRRGGRRHRGLEGTGDGQNGSVPGLGEQPVVNFEANMNRDLRPSVLASEAVAAPVISASALHLEESASAADEFVPVTAAEPVHLTAIHPEPAPASREPTPEPHKAAEDVQSSPVVRLAPVVEPEMAAVVEDVAPPAEPAPAAEPYVEPRPQPKPRSVRTGPAKKGWWQRSAG